MIIVFAAGGLTFALAQRPPAPAPRPARSSAPAQLSPGAVAAATANRQAAAWVAGQVSRSAIVACDPAMCSELQEQGFPAGDLLMLGAAAGDPLGSTWSWATSAVRSEFGSRLADVYAPTVLARFGARGRGSRSGSRRRTDGAYLVHAPPTSSPARPPAAAAAQPDCSVRGAGQQLSGGTVDSRLLITLATLAGQGRVRIAGGDPGPRASA